MKRRRRRRNKNVNDKVENCFRGKPIFVIVDCHCSLLGSMTSSPSALNATPHDYPTSKTTDMVTKIFVEVFNYIRDQYRVHMKKPSIIWRHLLPLHALPRMHLHHLSRAGSPILGHTHTIWVRISVGICANNRRHASISESLLVGNGTILVRHE